jgi:hypothetical protein
MDVLEIIHRLRDKRRAEKITPDHVPEVDLLGEINKEARKELNELYSSGKIGVTRTINGKAIYVRE